ncbi:MAG: hypothetical protein R2713_04780 [Ilumatobacteraceae bacterium]
MVITATVLPDVTGLDKAFDYRVPDASWTASVSARSCVSTCTADVSGAGSCAWANRTPIDGRGAPRPARPADQVVGPRPVGRDRRARRVGRAPLGERPAAAVPRGRRAAADGGVARPAGSRSAVASADASAGAGHLLADGGGVIRVSPTDDPMSIVLAARERGRVLVVHPSQEGAALVAARLRGAGLGVALLPDGWSAAASGSADTVVGARSAVWASVPDLAAIVVLDEHDEALQEQRTPTWHARDVAIERARRLGIPVVCVSPCPTVAALAWSGTRWMRPSAADERDGWPTVEIVDRRGEDPWKRSLVTSRLIEAIRDPAVRVVCVHNTPGRARLLACRTCRALLECERCAAAVHQGDDELLRCGRCGRRDHPCARRAARPCWPTCGPG